MDNSINLLSRLVAGKQIEIMATIQAGNSPDNIQEGAEGQCGAK